jgi:Dolichyl-phosphate-mannose-protein mannosyltransferase
MRTRRGTDVGRNVPTLIALLTLARLDRPLSLAHDKPAMTNVQASLQTESSVLQQDVSINEQSWFSGGMAIACLLASAAVLLQMATNGRYGYFRDELYYIATSDHLAWGYVDFAPLASLLPRVSRFLFGDSLHAIRFLPALANGAEIVLTGLITRELSGKRFAMLLACLSVLMAPVILGNGTRFSMNPFEPLFWMGSIYFLLRAMKRNQPELLAWCGVLRRAARAGIGKQTLDRVLSYQPHRWSSLYSRAALVS